MSRFQDIKDKLFVKSAEAQTAMHDSSVMKTVIINSLSTSLEKLARSDIRKGKLNPSKPYDLKPNAARLIDAWRKNPLTGKTLTSLNITDEELTAMMKEVLIKVGFKEIIE